MRAAAERGRSEKRRLEHGHGRVGARAWGCVLVKPIFFELFFATGLHVFDIFVVKTQQGFAAADMA